MGECAESRTCFSTNFAVSSEITCGDNLIPFCIFRFFSVEEQATHTSSGQEEFNCSVTSGARQRNPTVQCSIAMATQFTASVSISMTLDIHLSPEECLQVHMICELHCVERYSELLLAEINVFQARACVNQAD